MTDRKIVLGMPGYGKQTAAAGRAFWRATKAKNIYHNYQAGSLLASNFNQLWCLALNIVHNGQQVDYFAMLHDDVAPSDWWLDALIEELEAKELDVLSVAVPIKDNRGLTSMALAKLDGDGWMPHCRLSMHDVYQLPETFTSDDLGGYKLLLNTGCWVAKWNQEWCKRVHFEINDRIVFNRAANRFQSQTEPEDWHFSRQLHEIGTGPTAHLKPLRIGATRKIELMHTGETDYTNSKAWGKHHFDIESAQISPVPNAFPGEIAGWLTMQEAKALAEFAEGQTVLEIGSYCGLSTVCMARTAQHVTALDYFDGRGTPAPRDTLEEFSGNIARYGLTEKVAVAFPGSTLPRDSYTRVFIDAAHDQDSVAADLELAKSVMPEGGLIAFHDYAHDAHPGVKAVVESLLSDGGELLSVTDYLAVVRLPAAVPMEI